MHNACMGLYGNLAKKCAVIFATATRGLCNLFTCATRIICACDVIVKTVCASFRERAYNRNTVCIPMVDHADFSI